MAPFTTALAALDDAASTAPDETPCSWLDRLRAGDPEAFEQLAAGERPRLLAVARRVLRNDADAEDAVQEALWSAYRALPYYQATARLSTWLHRIVVNASLMRLRSQRRRRETLIDDLPEPERIRELAGAHHDATEEAELRALVRDAIGRLPAHYGRVLWLRDLQGCDTATTAASEGIGPDAVKMRLHRARAGLRAVLAPWLAAEVAS